MNIESSNFLHGLAREVLVYSCNDKLSPKWVWSRSRDVFTFWQISVNISKTVQNRDTQWKTNGKSYMAYQMAATVMTLNDLQAHSPVAGLFKCNPSNIYATFYTNSTDNVLAVHIR